MSLADWVLVILWLAVTAYALFAGADFGAGFWDLVAGSPQRGAAQRQLIEHSLGPVWEANHVWLIFALVVLWSGFPSAFASIMSTLYLPLFAVAFGIILRGSAFAFRKSVSGLALKRAFGATFALSSVITPYFLGSVAGAVASGRVPPGNAAGDAVGSWVNPTSVLGGVLAVGVCAFLAAVYLTADAARTQGTQLEEGFRTRALGTGVVVGVVAAVGVFVLRADSPGLFHGLTHRALPLMVLSALGGVTTLVLLAKRRYVLARPAAAIAVTSVVWGWGVGQYPFLLERSLTVDQGAAPPSALRPLLVTLVIAIVLVVPSLAYLYTTFQREEQDHS